MRALVCKAYGSPDDLVVEERDDPVPAAGEILVDIRAAGINFPDVLLIAGQYQVKTPPPFIPGHEAAGTVAAVGEGANRYKAGDRVIITPPTGAFAERCAVPEWLAMPIPGGLDFGQAAGFTITYSTSFHALCQHAGLREGETVLVLGAAGGVGVTAVEIAKALGARVIAAASTDEKLEFARSAGADETVNYGDTSLKETVREITGGDGADVIYDPVGGEIGEQALRAIARGGRYLVIGFASGAIPNFPANLLLLKEASAMGVWWGPWAMRNPARQADNLATMAGMIDKGQLRPRVTGSYSLDEFSEAFRAITARRVRGKVVFHMDRDRVSRALPRRP
jgi:NADPH2:quinone reductase